MKLFYDLHLHSCLSPCGSDDMTPNNLVNMAALLGFQLIAVTDHNACANTEAAVRAGCAAGITVVPGMELCTSEEAHIVCLFPTPAAALAFEREVARRSPPVRNRPEIFGRQLVLDADDALLREEDRYLLAAADLGAAEAAERVRALGGACFPAHIDREGYSLLASLGRSRRSRATALWRSACAAMSPRSCAITWSCSTCCCSKIPIRTIWRRCRTRRRGWICRKIPPPACWMRSTGALRRAGPAPAEGDAARRLFCTSSLIFSQFISCIFLCFPV